MHATGEQLLQKQAELQAEAKEVVGELGLNELLTQAGEPVLVGSAALGLMFWRDIDITVVCPKLSLATVSRLASTLMAKGRVREVRFLNDTGSWNVDPAYPDGIYLGLKYKSVRGMEWSLDLWFVDEPDRQPDLAHVKLIPERLTPETREAILKIKSIWALREEYRKTVRSYDIYRAVLDDRVRTPHEFAKWLEDKQTT